jgi:tetratricopeptide (TPR) repeat protein
VLDDPGETRNVAAEHPDLVEKMRDHLRFLLEKAPLPDDEGAGTGPESADAGTKSRLMALGYMGGWGSTPAGGELALLDPEGADPKDHVQEIAFVQKAFEALRRHRLEEARDLFLKAAHLAPEWWVPRKMAALAVSQMGRADEAIALLEEVIAIEPGEPETLFLLGMLYSRKGEIEKARDRIARAARADGNNLDARRWLATDAQRQAAWSAAVEHCREGLKVNPDDEYLLLLLAWVLATCPEDGIRSGKEARTLAEKACALTDHANPLALRSLAAACAENGDFDKAIEMAARASRLAASQRNGGLARQIDMIVNEHFRKGAPYRDVKKRGDQ